MLPVIPWRKTWACWRADDRVVPAYPRRPEWKSHGVESRDTMPLPKRSAGREAAAKRETYICLPCSWNKSSRSNYPGASATFGRKQVNHGNPQERGDAKHPRVGDRCFAGFPACDDVTTDIVTRAAKFSGKLLLVHPRSSRRSRMRPPMMLPCLILSFSGWVCV